MLEIQRLATQSVAAVREGRSLTGVLAAVWAEHAELTPQERGAITDLSYGALRFGARLDAILAHLVLKRLRDPALHWLWWVAWYQLIYTRAAPYAVVDHAVQCAGAVGAKHAGGLINAVLRNFLRRRNELLALADRTEEGRYAYPQWWIDLLRADYPDEFGAVLENGNVHPPFTLRVNRRRTSREAYAALLQGLGIAATVSGQDAITLAQALPVDQVPGFDRGDVSVQDAGAQLAAALLDASSGMRVLDACAAPGGKTTHLLEIADVEVTALDADAARLARVQQNLQRAGLSAQLVHADARNSGSWWDGRPFDRILADVPCTASGVVRRHPDIKWLRRPSDVASFARQQSELLDALWQLLASGGKLLYTTCSVFQQENSLQVADFLSRQPDAKRLPLCRTITLDATPEGQLLPNNEHDGFFYALLQKT